MAKNGSVYRFHDRVAIHLGEGPTQYLQPAEAWKLMRGLKAVRKSIVTDKESFAMSRCGTMHFQTEGIHDSK